MVGWVVMLVHRNLRITSRFDKFMPIESARKSEANIFFCSFILSVLVKYVVFRLLYNSSDC